VENSCIGAELIIAFDNYLYSFKDKGDYIALGRLIANRYENFQPVSRVFCESQFLFLVLTHSYIIKLISVVSIRTLLASIINMNNFTYGSPKPFSWTHEYLTKLLTEGGKSIVRTTNLQNAFKIVDRADFVPENQQAEAYQDHDIDLIHGAKLDKPTVIAQMLQLLHPAPGGNFLDIGSGSGYSAALLGVAGGNGSKVYSLERNQYLAELARINLKKYPFLNNVEIIFKDGALGYPEKAPYDAIHVSAEYATVPQQLLKQLKIGGYLAIPISDKQLAIYYRAGELEFRETRHKAYFFDKIQTGIV
jgi:protein-L-isoaspartate(D-aspartate) O-methyltransferase